MHGLTQFYLASTNEAREEIERRLIEAMEAAANRNRYDHITHVLTVQTAGSKLSVAIMLKALELYERFPSTERDVLLAVVNGDHNTTVKTKVLGILADRMLLLTLQELKQNGVPEKLKGPLDAAIERCHTLCLQKNHVASIAAFRARANAIVVPTRAPVPARPQVRQAAGMP